MNDELIEMTRNLNYEVQPIRILEFGERELTNKKLPSEKMFWNHHSVPDAIRRLNWKWENCTQTCMMHNEISGTKFFLGGEIVTSMLFAL
jgi:hypothetical protein